MKQGWITNIKNRWLRGLAAWVVVVVATPIILGLGVIDAACRGFMEACDAAAENYGQARSLWRAASSALWFEGGGEGVA